MKLATKVAIVSALAVCLAGCGSFAPGFRFAADQEQKQSAQIADDLAGPLAYTGSRPGSPAAKALKRATGPARTYAGEPNEPVDVSDLIAPEIGAWQTKNSQAKAHELKAKIQAETTAMVAESLAGLIERIEGKPKVDADQVVFRIEALGEMARIGQQIAAGIEIPMDVSLSPEEAARLEALDAAVARITAAAGAQAARRPTVSEVAEAAEDQALTTIDKVGGALEDYGLLALIPGAGGVVYAARKRKTAKAAQAEAARAEKEAARAGRTVVEQHEQLRATQMAAAAKDALATAANGTK